jgi:xylan 1,4-beta-xylosidase
MSGHPMRVLGVAFAWAMAASVHGAQPSPRPTSQPLPVSIHVDAASDEGPLPPIWRFFGCDEPNYATMPHGQKLLAELGELRPKQVYFRAHNLLTTGDGTPALKWGSTNAYTEDASGKAVYDWTIVDRIFDTYLARGVRPYAQIGFMPEALSIKPKPYRHHWKPGDKYESIYTGWSHPPKDYDRWRELVFQWAKHCAHRYGMAEVEQWYWQTWNEANIGYWQGTPQEFYKLHDFAAHGVRRAIPNARIGGPETAGFGGKFARDFYEHCLRGTNHATGERGTRLDFVSFHAKGKPEFVDGHVRMGIANQLAEIEKGFQLIASFPELKDKPIVIGESDPDGCAACSATHYPQNGYRNGTLYAAYTAASFARKYDLARKYGVNLEGALTWAFEFEGQPFFAGHRVLATNGIDLPVLNVFRMLAKMDGTRVKAKSDANAGVDAIRQSGVRSERPDVAALASRGERQLSVLVWHYHDDDVPGAAAEVKLSLAGLPVDAAKLTLHHYRIDDGHSNAFAAWKRMGSPQPPTADQYAELEKAGKLQELEAPHEVGGDVTFSLPRQAVSLLLITW